MDNEFKDWSKNDLEREVLKLRKLLSDQLSAAPGVAPAIEVQGIVTIEGRNPRVQMRAGEAAWEMTPAQARQHSLIILDAAVESERDAATIAFLEEDMGADETSVSQFLLMMRDHRKEWFEDFKKMDTVSE